MKKKRICVDNKRCYVWEFLAKVGTIPFGGLLSWEKPEVGKRIIAIDRKNKHALWVIKEAPDWSNSFSLYITKINPDGYVFADLI